MKLERLESLVQAAKLKRVKEGAHRFLVPRFEAEFRRIEIESHVVEQMAQLFIDPNLTRVVLDRFAEFRSQLVGMDDDLLDIAVFIDS